MNRSSATATFRRARKTVGELLAVRGARALATMMLLPFFGIYQPMVSAGALDSLAGAVGLGVIVFGGPAAVAIVIAELATTRAKAMKIVCLIGAVQLPAAAVSAAVATTLRAVLWVDGFAILTGVVLWLIAFDVARDSTPRWIPSFRAIGGLLAALIGLNLVAAPFVGDVAVVSPGDGFLAWVWVGLTADPAVVARSLAAAGAGVALVGTAVLLRPVCLRRIDVGRFRMGCAVALCLVGLEIGGVMADSPTLTVVVVSLVLSIETGNGE